MHHELLALGLAHVHAVGAAATGRPRTARAPRRAAPGSRRSDGCRPCRRAPPGGPAPSAIAVSSTVWWASMCDVAVGLDGEVEASACRPKRGEHVVVEPHAGGHVGAPGAVEVELDEHLRLLGLPLDARAAPLGAGLIVRPPSSLVSRASWNAAISSGVPIETRSQPAGPVTRISTPRSSRPCQTCLTVARTGRTRRSWRRCRRPRGPAPRSQVDQRGRARRAGPRPGASSSSACRRAARATAWVTALKVVGQAYDAQRVDTARARPRGSRGGRRPGRRPCSSCG